MGLKAQVLVLKYYGTDFGKSGLKSAVQACLEATYFFIVAGQAVSFGMVSGLSSRCVVDEGV